MMLMAIALAAAAASASLPAAMPKVVVIAHRGASGERPEHTLEAYRLAIAEGADFIEPDLVMTKDGQLVARHENEISGTTDIVDHPEFAARRTTKTVDGQAVSGWFAEDFTLAELKTLHARERLPQLRPEVARAWNDRLAIPSLAEILDLVAAERARTGRTIGIYPEIEHSTYFAALGLPIERPLVAALTAAGYTRRSDPVIIQSFETGNLKALHRLTELRLVQLVAATGAPYDRVAAGDSTTTYASMTTPAGLRAIARYPQALGPEKTMIVPRDPQERSVPPTRLVRDAHAAGLVVHPWTFRSENAFLPLELRSGPSSAAHGDSAAEYRQFFALGVDGLFTEFPAEAVAVRASLP